MSGQIVQFRPTVGYDSEALTVSNSVQVLTPSKYKQSATSGGASDAFLTNYGAAIRYRYDGGTPSATVGHVLADGGNLTLRGQNQMADFKCFRLSSTDSEIYVTYERE
jgi:hypothetical protein